MQGIFIVLSGMGIRSVAACIIVFTVITKMLMLPLTIKQQKFTKVNALMTPEIQAIQKKYANKKDQASMAKMQLEQQQVYDKYGSSMSAGYLPSLIQFPILFALYPVIYDLEKYILSWRIIPRVKFRPCTSSWERIWRPLQAFLSREF